MTLNKIHAVPEATPSTARPLMYEFPFKGIRLYTVLLEIRFEIEISPEK